MSKINDTFEGWFIGALRRTNNFVRRQSPERCPLCGGPVGPDGRSTHIDGKRDNRDDPQPRSGLK